MPKIVVFAGKGSSHSWSWFADFLERVGEYDARFLDSQDMIESFNHGSETVVISGGDGYSIAESLRGIGFARLKDFIHQGGRYVGICAGAYLPLHSSIEPFNEFNLSTTKIENIDCGLRRKDEQPRVSVPYGACSIIHPVRGEVEISRGGSRSVAPLYGGPVFREPSSDEVLARYAGFRPDTEFQVERERAEGMVLGRPAAIRCGCGRGDVFLFGPHLEHPAYPSANRVLRDLLGLDAGIRRSSDAKGRVPAPLARSLADLKVAALGLEGRSFLVGKKLWDADRFLVLVRAIERRASSIQQDDIARVRSGLDAVRRILLKTSVGVESDVDEATVLLVSCARVCVDSHFRSMVAGK